MFDELVGNNVRIIPMEIHHTEELYTVVHDSMIWTHLPMTITSINDMELLVERALENKKSGTEFPFVVINRKNNQMIGSTRFLNISIPSKNLEIGWTWYTPTVWGTHLNTECKYLLLQYCFETLNLIRVQFKTDNLNVRSQKAIEKIGGVREGVLRNHMIREDGTFRHSVFYSIIESEWMSVKEKLETLLSK